ncbi:unnamed protein product [Musa acuminata subsp. burmannicoides]
MYLQEMRSITARGSLESLSFSRRHFHWIVGKLGGGEGKRFGEEEEEEEGILAFSSVSSARYAYGDEASVKLETAQPQSERKKVLSASAAGKAVSRLRSVLSFAIGSRHRQLGLGHRVTGTLYGRRGGHMHFAIQVDPRACPAMLIELATSTRALVREMASGLVRIALECERRAGTGNRRLLEEPLWRAYCNGKKHGHAARRECGPADWRVLRAVEPVTMGAGVLPADGGADGEVMYMRARFERVVGSQDSEAFYMMNPDSSGGPELTIYLLRV